jgi:hypothetical protein
VSDNRFKPGRPDITCSIEELKYLYEKSTQVVGWYAHPAEVRGPFCRWLEVSEVASQYEKYVGSRADDAAYAAMAMNMAPHLIDQVETLCAELERHKAMLAVATEALKKYMFLETTVNIFQLDVGQEAREALKEIQAKLAEMCGEEKPDVD